MARRGEAYGVRVLRSFRGANPNDPTRKDGYPSYSYTADDYITRRDSSQSGGIHDAWLSYDPAAAKGHATRLGAKQGIVVAVRIQLADIGLLDQS